MGTRDSDAIEVQEGSEFSGKTIVGGQPMERRKVKLSIPAGIEKALYKASVDPAFKAMLLSDRKRAIEDHCLRLTAIESQILQAVPDERLAFMIGRIQPARHGKRKFMKAIATAVVTLASSTALVTTEGCNTGDVRDVRDVRVDATPDTVGGIWPDAPYDLPDESVVDPFDTLQDEVTVDAMPDTVGGIWPDVPEEDMEDIGDPGEDEDGADDVNADETEVDGFDDSDGSDVIVETAE